jgi:hypothetical protein
VCRSTEGHTHHQQETPEGEETNVKQELVWAWSDVVDPQDVVVDDALDEVENPPTGEDPSQQVLAARAEHVGTAPPERHEPDDQEPIRHGVEQAISERVHLKAADISRGEIPRTGQHVMPLQDLVQQDAIEESAETQSQQDPRFSEMSCCALPFRFGHCHGCPTSLN